MFDVVVVYPLMVFDGVTQVLLGRKNTGLGVGRIVGPGGKVEPGEQPRQAAVRELAEEVGLLAKPEWLEPIAQISYPFPDRPHLSQRSHAFALRRFSGEVVASDELSPQWWPVDQIPFAKMWADAELWLPRALAGEFQQATITIGVADEVVDVAWQMREREDKMNLFDADLNQLRERLDQLDEWARAVDSDDPNREALREQVFPHGIDESDWNDYHRVRSEYDRRAAEEFDLGQ